MPSRRKPRGADRGRGPEIAENARAGRHADQAEDRAGTEASSRRRKPKPEEQRAYRAERDEARARGRMQGTQGFDMGHYHAAAGGRDEATSYPPGFNWGPRSGYAEEQPSGAPYDLSHDAKSFVAWREARLQEADRAYYRWRGDLARQIDETFKRWLDSQQQAFTEDFERWQKERRESGEAPESHRGEPRPRGRAKGR
ncbi:MAG TPA: hypothetical protein VF274_00060 [Alphaproteobacteria bacterium]|jgi:hypothetical protein